MYWANFLHFYQPPDQSKMIIDKVVTEGYRPLFKVLENHREAKLTINISGCLLDLLVLNGYEDVITSLRKLVENGQVELTASAKYHPFLPYLPKDEIVHQIEINNQSLKKYLGNDIQLRGFYSPEAGYSLELAKLVYSLGYTWTIIDEVGYSGSIAFPNYNFTETPGFYSGGLDLKTIVGDVSEDRKAVDYSRMYALKDIPEFHVFFRERVISDALASGQIKSADQFLNVLGDELTKNRYLFTGTDGEAYGHHQPGLEKVLDELLSKSELQTTTLSELLTLFSSVEYTEPFPCSWGTSEKEIKEKNYYSRWRHPENEIHELQWALNDLVIKLVERAEKQGSSNALEARELLDKAVYSCHFWWASARPWWSIELVERGAKALLNTIEPLESLSIEEKEKVRNLYLKIITTAFDWLRKGVVWDLSHKHS